MKKIKLKFQKRVISVLSGEDLAKVWGGAKKIYSLDSCETKEECDSVMHCESKQDSCQGKCFSDSGCGSGHTEPLLNRLYTEPPLDEQESGYCETVPSFDTMCKDPYKPSL